ncbi:outer membrane beta-barrel protein [Mucilaginibacter pedocola]|nr:outer membrane beta-barrel protein [Mucilaginibacter pedocola]
MKKLIIFIMLLIPAALMAQVSGKIIDSKGQPVAFATVTLLNSADSTSVQTVQSDMEGTFAFATPKAGSYLLRISAVGYAIYSTPTFALTAAQTARDMGTITLTENKRQLNEVLIRATKPATVQRADGTIVNVDAGILSKGSSALEVLERSPGVAIDRQNSGISLNGKSGVQVMVNGKVTRMPVAQVVAMLNGMSANDVSRIELLTNPSAAYDAEGSGGLINIVLKENRKSGTNGSLTATAGYGYREKGGIGGRIAHNNGKTNLYASYNFNRDNTYSDFHATGSEQEPFLGGPAQSDYKSITTGAAHSQNGTAGIELIPDSLTTLGAGIIFNQSTFRNATQNRGVYFVGDSVYRLNADIAGRSRWQSMNYNLFLNKQINQDQKLNLNADYTRYSSGNPIDVNSTFLSSTGRPVNSNDTLFSPRQKGNSNTLIHQFAAQADYSAQLSPQLSLNAGLKETYTKTNTSSAIESLLQAGYVTRPFAQSNNRFTENIGAAYVAADWKPDSLTSIQTGLRYEYATRSVTGSKVGTLFPNVLLTRTLPGQAELYLSYNRRISRPSFSDLASYVTYNGPQSVNTGNPNLKSTITNAIRLGYRRAGYSASVSYSRDNNPIARYQSVYTPDSLQMAVSPQNLRYQNNLLLQLSAPVRVSNWWDMNYDISGGWRKFALDYTPVPAQKTYFAYNLHGTQLFKLSPDLSLEVSGYYNSAAYNGSKKVDGYGALNAGLKMELKNNGGTLQLSATDLLMSGTVTSYYGVLTREAFDLNTHVDFHPESARRPIFKLSYTRTFGGRNRGAVERQKTSSPEQDRIGQ